MTLPLRNTILTHHLVIVRPEAPGQYLAQILGLPEVRATAATAEQAVDRARTKLAELLASAQIVPISVPVPRGQQANAPAAPPPAPLDATEQAYLEELARSRREDLERTLQEDEQACFGSSSTPTT